MTPNFLDGSWRHFYRGNSTPVHRENFHYVSSTINLQQFWTILQITHVLVKFDANLTFQNSPCRLRFWGDFSVSRLWLGPRSQVFASWNGCSSRMYSLVVAFRRFGLTKRRFSSFEIMYSRWSMFGRFSAVFNCFLENSAFPLEFKVLKVPQYFPSNNWLFQKISGKYRGRDWVSFAILEWSGKYPYWWREPLIEFSYEPRHHVDLAIVHRGTREITGAERRNDQDLENALWCMVSSTACERNYFYCERDLEVLLFRKRLRKSWSGSHPCQIAWETSMK